MEQVPVRFWHRAQCLVYIFNLNLKKMKRKESSHPSLVRLFQNIVRDTPVVKSGTYNRQDPTYFEKGWQTFQYGGENFCIEYNDVTWGIEVTISRVTYFPESKAIWREKEIAGFYLDRDYHATTVIYRQRDSKGVIGLLMRAFHYVLNPQFEISKNEEENEEWIDPAGGVHVGYDEPWKMYE